ncbi:sensor histidine kinase [Pseudonocardia asaccharolytica]|uniref:Histidine kinase n=1 Tax=Pseudonocardia asaccharolytica DSM 44247 = NBRC 16224 TaxID=1123024 RepID=A0A511D6H3_9PSEU|nr:GAF domain-containing protein [Pseudonocardia asaccharolytica]GEL20386.1 histidine kinase [Pseudonocardia asaccharolytica DSM 44247 = NBRC 16224]
MAGREAHHVNAEDPAAGAGDAGQQEELTFPDLPRMELDQLLGQLIERAQEVMGTQERLRGLLRASQAIIGDLTLPTVLSRIVEAARELVGARYAALGVIAAHGGLAEFVHSGMPPEDVARIGHLPQGKGLLGALIDDPRPIRLRRISDDVRSSGFPSGHPPMTTFLGVPIRVRDEIFGNLYLSESRNGEFSAEDEELVTALAATAGVAIENARLYEDSRTRGEWLRASAAITRRMLSSDTSHSGQALRFIAECCRDIAQADLVSVVLPTGDGEHLRMEVVVGAGADQLQGREVPVQGSLVGQVFASGRPLRVDTADERPGLEFFASRVLDIGPVLVVPLAGSNQVNGVISSARLSGRPGFTSEDLDMAAGFANQASISIELAEARAEQQRAAMLDERDRIAADLHDHVIQRLFAAGLSLQSVAASLGPGRSTDRVVGTIRDLDDTIKQIRTTIFQLHRSGGATPAGLRSRLLDVVADLTEVLGFEPALRFSGLLEDTVGDDVAEDLTAVLREALTNVARHARARSAEIDIIAGADRLTLDVRDDGVGIGSSTRRSGLANLRHRAERHGGILTLDSREPCGTHLCWSIPNS